MTDLQTGKPKSRFAAILSALLSWKKQLFRYEYTVGEEQIVVHYRQDALTAWAVDAAGNLLPGVSPTSSRGWILIPGLKFISQKENHLKERLR